MLKIFSEMLQQIYYYAYIYEEFIYEWIHR